MEAFDVKLRDGIDNGIPFLDIVDSFTDEEIQELRGWLEENCDYCYDFLDMPYVDGTFKEEWEKRSYLVMDYVRELACGSIRCGKLPWNEVSKIARLVM